MNTVATNAPERCSHACRLIRGQWSSEERRRRQRLAKGKQRELWQWLEAAEKESTTQAADLSRGAGDRKEVLVS